MGVVFNDENIKGNEKLLMLALADNANDSGVCFPSWNVLMQKTSMSKNSLAKWLNTLEEKGMLFRKQRSRKNGSKTSNKFLIYPHLNKDFLDFEDMEIFHDLYTKVPKCELGYAQTQSTKSMTTKVPKGELGYGTKVPKGEPLEPSLNTNRHSNRHLCVDDINNIEAVDFCHTYNLNDYPNINIKAFNEWMNYKKYKHKGSITKTLNMLHKYSYETQQTIVDQSIMNEYKGLFEPKQQNAHSFKQQDAKKTEDSIDMYYEMKEKGFSLREPGYGMKKDYEDAEVLNVK